MYPRQYGCWSIVNAEAPLLIAATTVSSRSQPASKSSVRPDRCIALFDDIVVSLVRADSVDDDPVGLGGDGLCDLFNLSWNRWRIGVDIDELDAEICGRIHATLVQVGEEACWCSNADVVDDKLL